MNSNQIKWFYSKLKDDDFNVEEDGVHLKFTKKIDLGADIYKGDVCADIDGRVIPIHNGCYLVVVNITSNAVSREGLHGGDMKLQLRAYDIKEVVGLFGVIGKMKQIAELLNVVQHD